MAQRNSNRKAKNKGKRKLMHGSLCAWLNVAATERQRIKG